MPSSHSPDELRPVCPTASTAVRVHVMSEEPVVRAGIRCLLESHTDSLVFTDDEIGQPADVVLFDVLGLHLDPGRRLEEVVGCHPGRVLALSRTLQPGLTARALDAGAVAAVPLGATAGTLMAAIHYVVEGRLHDGSPVERANREDRDRRLGRDSCLSWREQQVLSLIVRGASNQLIGSTLNITINTVKTYVRATYVKIGVSNRSQAVAWAVEHGYPTRSALP